MDLKLHFSLSLSLVTCFVTSSLHCNSASAQVTSDGTTGTIVDANGNSFEINSGTRSGGNLFHSFGEFSVPSGGEAVFNNAENISNILSRVTGGNISSINGLIKANGSANLFLINPAGIIFGPGASLSIGGSFYGSTADSVVFEDGEFSAVNNLNQPILTINAPIGLNLRDNPADITMRGNENAAELADFSALSVFEGQSLNLIGGNIELNDALILAIGGNVALGGLQDSGTVNINENGNLNFPENVARGNISLDNTRVSVAFGGDGEGGTINLDANNIELLSASLLQGGIDANSGFAEAQAGNINLDATGTISLSEQSNIQNTVNSGAEGNSGDINITTANLNLTSGGTVSTNTFGQGNGGSILVNATKAISLDSENLTSGLGSGIISIVDSKAVGNAGDIAITTESFTLTKGGRVSASVFGKGDGGEIQVNVDKDLFIDGTVSSGQFASGIFSRVEKNAIGTGGNVSVSANNILINNSAGINSGNFGIQGDAGEVFVNARNDISINGIARNSQFNSGIFSAIGENTIGDGGKLNINTYNLKVSKGGTVSSINIGEGNAGDISITTSELSLNNGARILASTFGQGNAGLITINADKLSVDGVGSDANGTNVFNSGVYSTIESTGVGNAEGINITTSELSLTNGGVINGSTFGRGNAGALTIKADNIFLDGVGSNGFSSAIGSTMQGQEGNAGDISITTSELSLNNGAGIFASSSGEGNGGNLTFNIEDRLILEENSTISANLRYCYTRFNPRGGLYHNLRNHNSMFCITYFQFY
jgi:filamentous hemagglutinin family protein